MTETLRSKDELLAIFADGPVKASKQDVRDLIVSTLANQTQTETTPGQAMLEETDLFVADTGATDMILATIASFGNRMATVMNLAATSLTINPNGAETIDSNASLTIDPGSVAIFLADAGFPSDNWFTLVNTSAAASNDYALAYIEASVALTTILDGTFVDINESLSTGPNSTDFTIAAGEITYNGIEDKIFAVDVSITAAKTTGGNVQYSYAVAVNDAPLSPIVADNVTTVYDSMSIVGIITLSTNDTVKVQIRGDGTTESLNVQDLNLRLTEIRQ